MSDSFDFGPIVLDPFPHALVRGAVSEDAYKLLDGADVWENPPAPTEEVARSGGYVRRAADTFLQDPVLPWAWKEFWARRLRPLFVSRLLDFWGPLLLPRVTRADACSLGIRGLPGEKGKARDFLLDAHYNWRAPPPGRPDPGVAPHLDHPRIAVILLWYFKPRGDQAPGGGLRLYKALPGVKVDDKRYVTTPDLLEPAVDIPYEPNTLVMFLNSPKSVHGGMPYDSPLPRRHVGINLEVTGGPLFELPKG